MLVGLTPIGHAARMSHNNNGWARFMAFMRLFVSTDSAFSKKIHHRQHVLRIT